jgi:drug/metabolite transporter (DMT)-like permease
MTSMSWFALGMAVFGAFSYATGSILQAVGAKRSHSTASTLGHPLYLVGVVFDIVAWIGAIVALQHLAVYVVESVLAGSLAVTAVAAWLFLGSTLRRRDVVAIVCTTGALGVLALSAGQQHEMLPSTQVRIGLALALLLLWVLGYGATKTGRPGLIAMIGGFSLGGAAISGRALQFPEEEMRQFTTGFVAVVTEPVTWTMIAFALTGMLLYASALQGGEVGRVTAVHWTGEVVLPSIIALTLIGDTVRTGWELPALAAGLVTVSAAIVLASAPAAVAPAGDEPVPAHLHAGAVVVPPPRAGALFPAEAWRLSIPAEAYWPALQPPLVRGYGSFMWWGSASTPQPLWVPPDRTLTPPNAIPAWAGPQLPDSRTTTASGAQPVLRRPRRLTAPRHAALPAARRSRRPAA